MKSYDFKKMFVGYVLLLSFIMSLIYIGIIVLFNWQVDSEIKETADSQRSYLIETINQHESVNEGTYYFVAKDNRVLTNHSPFSADSLQQLTRFDSDHFYIWKTSKGTYSVSSTQQKDQRIYSMLNVTDYDETKDLLYRLLLGTFAATLLFILGAAYYIAIKPIRTYEAMLTEHKEFIQNASHEMKTPIASISLGLDYIKALDGNKLSEGSMNALTKIKKEIYYMQRIILNALHIDDKSEQAPTIDVAAVIDETSAAQQQLTGLKILTNYAEPLEYQISPIIVKQLVIILIDNAVKHNDADVQIEISAKVEDKLIIEVQDNGRGINQQQLESIFDRYYRGDTASSGSGIGLSLLKEIVEQHNGKIEVKSTLHQGTKFLITI